MVGIIMTDKTLYKYIREDSGITTSVDKPNCEYTTLHRLIAGEGKILTDGVNETLCVDTDDTNIWNEIEYIEPKI